MNNWYYVREVRAVYKGKKKLESGPFKSPSDIAAFVRKILPDNMQEHYFVLLLDGAHQLLAYTVVCTGTANACQIHPREIFRSAILQGACAIIIGHNHPSGSLTPSDADTTTRHKTIEASKIIGINILDDLIVSESGYYSALEQNTLN